MKAAKTARRSASRKTKKEIVRTVIEEKDRNRSIRNLPDFHLVLLVTLVVLVVAIFVFSQDTGFTGMIVGGSSLRNQDVMGVRVVDNSGNAVGNAMLSAYVPWDGNRPVLQTSEFKDGVYSVVIEDGILSYTLDVCAPGFEKASVKFMSKPSSTEIVLSPGNSQC